MAEVTELGQASRKVAMEIVVVRMERPAAAMTLSKSRCASLPDHNVRPLRPPSFRNYRSPNAPRK